MVISNGVILGKKKKRKKADQQTQAVKQIPQKSINRARTTKKRRQSVPQRREQPNWPLTALAAVGLGLTLYLAITSLLGGQPLYCDKGSTCDIVQQSRWGRFLGMPISFWGFLTYMVLAFIGFSVRKIRLHWKLAWTVSMAGLGYSLYLNTISLVVMRATCFYCLASLFIMALIFSVVTFQRPKMLPNFKFPILAAEAAVLTLLIVGGMHLHYSGIFDSTSGPEDSYLRGLAEHLTREKAVFYGAFW